MLLILFHSLPRLKCSEASKHAEIAFFLLVSLIFLRQKSLPLSLARVMYESMLEHGKYITNLSSAMCAAPVFCLASRLDT